MRQGANTADAATALAQFDGKKPCWTDPLSASGYVIPSGIVGYDRCQGQSGCLRHRPPDGRHAPCTLKGICDFGATYIDARTSSLAEGPG